MSFYNIEGVNIPHVGYGRMAWEIKNAMLDMVTFSEDSEAVVFAMTPQMVKGWWKGQRTGLITMWETSVLPAPFRRLSSMFDVLFVPCDHNAELFAPYHSNIQVMPLGINHELWHPVRDVKNSKFRFMTGGSGWERKGIPQVIKAFQLADLPDSELVIKCPPDLYDEPREYGLTDNMTLIREALDPVTERNLHATADCFVSATRGEGFGLIPLQQAALGNLVIAPNHTGHAMFADVFDWIPVCRPEKANMLNHAECGDWMVPDMDEMVDAMRAAYERGRPSITERKIRAERTARFTWGNAANILLGGLPPGGLLKDKEWVYCGGDGRLVRALRKVEADVGIYKIRLKVGEEKLIPAVTVEHLVSSGAVAEI